MDMKNIDEEIVLAMVYAEYAGASRFPLFHSAHEGLAVLQEEVKELRDEVYLKHSKRSAARLQKEAIQVAAMAIKLVVLMNNANLENPVYWFDEDDRIP